MVLVPLFFFIEMEIQYTIFYPGRYSLRKHCMNRNFFLLYILRYFIHITGNKAYIFFFPFSGIPFSGIRRNRLICFFLVAGILALYFNLVYHFVGFLAVYDIEITFFIFVSIRISRVSSD